MAANASGSFGYWFVPFAYTSHYILNRYKSRFWQRKTISCSSSCYWQLYVYIIEKKHEQNRWITSSTQNEQLTRRVRYIDIILSPGGSERKGAMQTQFTWKKNEKVSLHGIYAENGSPSDRACCSAFDRAYIVARATWEFISIVSALVRQKSGVICCLLQISTRLLASSRYLATEGYYM